METFIDEMAAVKEIDHFDGNGTINSFVAAADGSPDVYIVDTFAKANQESSTLTKREGIASLLNLSLLQTNSKLTAIII